MAANTHPSSGRGKKIFFGLLLALAAYAGLETVVHLVYRPEIPLPAAADSLATPDPTPGREQAGLGFRDPSMTLHPYLGYVFLPPSERDTPPRIPISEDGFLDSRSAIRKRSPEKILVGLTGGSVSGQMGSLHADKLADAFARHLGNERTFEFVWLGMPGYHQPQQLIQFAYVLAQGGEFDLLINLDGFNELAVPGALNVPQGEHPLFPMNWSMVALDVPDPELRRNLGAVAYLKEERQRRSDAFRSSIWSRSPVARLVHRTRDRRLETRISHHAWLVKEFPAEEIPWFVHGPKRDHEPQGGLVPSLIGVWKRSSLEMKALCDAHDIRYLHCLQPNQYDPGSKPLSGKEKKEAIEEESPYRPMVEEGYPLLRDAGNELRAEGVDFHDLSFAFSDVGKTLYVDNCCHYNGDGNAILAEALARAARGVMTLEGSE